MALPALTLEEVKVMNEKQRTAYFDKYARFSEDSPTAPYAIRIGSKIFI